ncbi:MAG: hypothetical protein K2G36_00360 [Ruminococcus sp.]|nr:hypothetical protein [Ruminococcus sp.]
MRLDVIKEIYSFYPKLLIDEIGEKVISRISLYTTTNTNPNDIKHYTSL